MLQGNRNTFLEQNFILIALVALGLIAGVVVGGNFLLQQTLDDQTSDSRVINIAGRQRMLSQQISKNAARILSTDNVALRTPYVNQLDDALDLWSASHDGLRFGSVPLNLPGNNSDEVKNLFAAIQPNYEAMLSSGRCIVALELGEGLATGCSTDIDALAGVILDNESDFLTGMNQIVFQYDSEAADRVGEAQDTQRIFTYASLGLLAIVFLFVFVPMGVYLRRSLSSLRHNEATLSEREGTLAAAQERSEILNRNLQAVIDLNSRVSTILNVEQLMRDVVDLTKDRFQLYHAHIYLLDTKGQNLVLAAGAGYIGDLMVAEQRSIALDNMSSLVARAGRSLGTVVVNDIRRSSDFLPHPLLPDTQSELAVALVARGQLIGVLDVQSDQINFFDSDTQQVMEVAAIQIATALSNATLFESLRRVSSHEQALGNISRSIENATSVEDILQNTVRELGKALRVPLTAIELQLVDQPEKSTRDNRRGAP